MKELIKEELKTAKRRLDAAKLLFRNNMLEDAISRVYYAVFYAAKAMLNSAGYDAKTHKGLISEFGLRFVKEGIVPKRYGGVLRRIFEARESSDYEIYAIFENTEVKELLKQAEDFINMAEKFVRERIS